MPEPLSDQELYEKARRRVEAKKSFFIHLSVYIIVNILIFIIWFVTGAGYPWFIFPLAGWGVGLLFHALGVFAWAENTEWEHREVEKEVERLRKRSK